MKTNTLSPKRVALQNARKAMKFTRSDLADKVGVSVDHIKSLEYGRVNPSMPLMFKICSVLQSSPEVLFSDLMPEN